MPLLKDLKGKRFGKLIVTGDSVTRDGRPWWPTLCDCGKESFKSSRVLNNGEAKSCGCSMGQPPSRDRSGEKLGRLLLLERIKKNNRYYYRCHCDCGKIVEVESQNLISRKNKPTRSCGCLQHEAIRKPNEIILFSDHAEIIIESKRGIFRAKVDLETVPLIRPYRWSINSDNYVGTTIRNKHVALHHMILPKKKGFVCDHVNRNPLDNRKTNLRYATNQQNRWNSSSDKEHRGVIYIKEAKKWRAGIVVNGKDTFLGDYDTKEEGLFAYDFVARKLRGEFSVTNFLEIPLGYIKKWLDKAEKDLLRKQNEMSTLQNRIKELTEILTKAPPTV